MSEKLGTLSDLTPVKALDKPHKTTQTPIYKEGLPELVKINDTIETYRTHTCWFC